MTDQVLQAIITEFAKTTPYSIEACKRAAALLRELGVEITSESLWAVVGKDLAIKQFLKGAETRL